MDWSVVFDNSGVFLSGLWMTIQLSVVSAAIAAVAGLLIALMRISRLRVLRIIAAAYINVLRSVPPFALIIYVYYGIAIAVGIDFPPFTAGVLALAAQYAAWMAEVYRAGIQAVPSGQSEAAYSLGFSRPRAFATVILPQALRIVIPPLGNNVVGLIKDSSLVSYIGVQELIRNSQLLVSTTFRPFEVYTATLIIYLVLTIAISQVFGWLERRHATGRDALGQRHRLSRARAARIAQLQELARTP